VAEEQKDNEELNRELIELLNELRVALPGVQVLFAFLLAVPFANGWKTVTPLQRDVFFASFLCTAGATALLIAPSAYHRLRWREHDKERMLVTSNRLTIAGMGMLALAISGSIFLITDILFDLWEAVLVTAIVAAVFAWLWYGLPLWRRATE
jgi:Family of unknown function (DUF6328)